METKSEQEDVEHTGIVSITGISISSSSNSENESDANESVHLPAISPISSSSGVFSCGSTSSSNFASKPTTPTNLPLTDKPDDDGFLRPATTDKATDEIIVIKDNLSDTAELAISKRCDGEQVDSDSKSSRHSISKASTSKSVKIRSKHRQSRKSLDDEIVIYESDSSLQIDPRRRNIHAMYSNRAIHQSMSRGATAISRRKSEENSTATQPSNQIVSILKRKDSSTSSNASLVTFSPNVIDIEPTSSRRTAHRQGILKKRSSLDESLRYRSHSPSSASSESEKGCLVRNNRRRNSSEEINHHGILKQKSYDSSGGGSAAGYSSGIGGSSGGYNTPNSSSSGVQGILKKPSLTPSDHSHDQPTKHVSISEAVILAAAELCKDMIIIDDCQSESYIKPILKLDSDYPPERRPKPILKKNHSSESEEIRSILKSRKSSREESFQDDL